MSTTSKATPPYICEWEKYSSTLNLNTFHKLLPVHDNILKVLGQVIPATVIRLSKKHYNQIIPILYRHIKFDSTNTQRFFRGWTVPEHPQEEIHWSEMQKEMMIHVKTISFLDEKTMLDFNINLLKLHRLIENDGILTSFFAQITQLQLDQQLVIASGRNWSEAEDVESPSTLVILLRSFEFYLDRYHVCFNVPEDTCAVEPKDLSPDTKVTEEEHNRTCHIIAFWNGIHAKFEVVEDLRNKPQCYIFHWPNSGHTMTSGITNIITYRQHHFLKSPIILDLTGMDDAIACQLPLYLKPSDLFWFVDHKGDKQDTNIYVIAPNNEEMATMMAVVSRSTNSDVRTRVEEFLNMVSDFEKRVIYWKDEKKEEGWECPCGQGHRKPSEEGEE
ncbi:uncharacterized protein L199_002423 [Kwoniella botswanensis]|uniref:uncharacterized protein n=1 Tax=Kwoniella botswanensis TaxID=1268659 RepID=UPI00315C868F